MSRIKSVGAGGAPVPVGLSMLELLISTPRLTNEKPFSKLPVRAWAPGCKRLACRNVRSSQAPDPALRHRKAHVAPPETGTLWFKRVPFRVLCVFRSACQVHVDSESLSPETRYSFRSYLLN